MSDQKFTLAVPLTEETLGPAFQQLKGVDFIGEEVQKASAFAKTSATIKQAGDMAISAFKTLQLFGVSEEEAIRIVAEGQFFMGYTARDYIGQTQPKPSEDTVDAGAGI